MGIKVMLVDDHTLVREGIRYLLELDESITVVDEAKDGEECLVKLSHSLPDILLLDIHMPKKNGIEVLQKIREKNIDVKVLIITAHKESNYFVKAMEIGVEGYLLKDSEVAELKKAINIIMSGENYIQPSLNIALNNRSLSRKNNRAKIEYLTKRELEVLTYVANGMINKEIATRLNISERTVKNHISSIFKKIEVSDRTQAAVFAIKNDIIRLF